MALAKVTIEALTQMANTLRQSADDILATKEQMDNALRSFPWDDPIGLSFISRYEDDFKPLKNYLIPNIESYIQYMQNEGAIVSEYSGESAGGFGIGGAVGAGAFGVGLGVAGAARINSNLPKTDLFSNPSESINRDTKKKKDQSEFEDPLDYVITDSEKMGQSEFADPFDLIGKGSPAPPPPVFETDQSSIRAAAAGILEEMTEKDLYIDSNEMQNQLSVKTDEIFRNKYNRSLNEIGIDSGFNPETSGYYDDYNKISEELRIELVEMKEKFEPTPIRYMDNDAVYSELSLEDRRFYDDKKSRILEQRENAVFQWKIAKTNAFGDADFDTPQNVRNRDYAQIYEADKEIMKAEEELEKLAMEARETLRNNRNQKIADYIGNSRK